MSVPNDSEEQEVRDALLGWIDVLSFHANRQYRPYSHYKVILDALLREVVAEDILDQIVEHEGPELLPISKHVIDLLGHDPAEPYPTNPTPKQIRRIVRCSLIERGIEAAHTEPRGEPKRWDNPPLRLRVHQAAERLHRGV